MDALLAVSDLSVTFNRRGVESMKAVDGVSFSVAPGQTVGLVGESGCGKSVTSLAIMRLLPRRGNTVTGRVDFEGADLLRLPLGEMRDRRGRDLAMIFQDPLSSLNPVVPIGIQVTEVLERHRGMKRSAAMGEARELLDSVGIPDPGRRLREYPHQLSGGMRQRALIAMALACRPRLLIADEPTTALDVTIQAQILSLLKSLVDEHGTALIMITHDLGVVAGLCDEVNVLYAGRVVEKLSAATKGAEVLLEVNDLQVHFPIRKGIIFDKVIGYVYAVDGVSLAVKRGETYGLVGESGCGKTTLGRAILRLIEPTGGSVNFDGANVAELSAEPLRQLRRRMQMVFQDPLSSLDPRQSVQSILLEGMRAHGLDTAGGAGARRLRELLSAVGLPVNALRKFPHEFSGGQRQRIGIARALAVEPDLIVADEPVSALDVSVQAQVINVLEDLQADLGLTYLVIAHDLAVVRHISDRVGVMYLGALVEEATSADLYARPLHPYSRALLSAVPVPDPVVEDSRERILLTGDLPSPANPPSGCRFHTRCPWRQPTLCDTDRPVLAEFTPGHRVACHYAGQIAAGQIAPHRVAESVI